MKSKLNYAADMFTTTMKIHYVLNFICCNKLAKLQKKIDEDHGSSNNKSTTSMLCYEVIKKSIEHGLLSRMF